MCMLSSSSFVFARECQNTDQSCLYYTPGTFERSHHPGVPAIGTLLLKWLASGFAERTEACRSYRHIALMATDDSGMRTPDICLA